MNFANKYGQWALVTGGSNGIGLGLAKQAATHMGQRLAGDKNRKPGNVIGCVFGSA